MLAIPRIIFNSDGDQGLTLGRLSEQPDLLCRTVDELASTQVDVFSYSVCTGGDTFCHRSKVAPILGDGITAGEQIPEWVKLRIENVRWLHRQNIDPVTVLERRCAELNIQFWASIRMNDDHDSYPGYDWLHGSYRPAHRELLIGAPYPDFDGGSHAKPRYCWAFDYSHDQVRTRQLALVEELLADYELDGIELDFLRSPHYFRKGRESAGMPLLTDFLKRVRSMVDDAAARARRTIALAVRVPGAVDECRRRGLDVASWLSAVRPDFVIPMSSGRLDMEADLRAFTRLTEGTTTVIVGGLESRAYGYGHLPAFDTGMWRHATIAMMRAAAMNCFHQGAGGIYLFNYEHRFRNFHHAYTAEEQQVLREIGAPDAIAYRDKRYVVTVDQQTELEELTESKEKQLPALLTSDRPEGSFTFFVGDDLETAQQRGVVEAVRLRLSASRLGLPSPGDRLADRLVLELNGRRIERDQNIWRPQALLFSNVPAVRGANQVRVAAADPASLETHPLQLTGIELLVEYRR